MEPYVKGMVSVIIPCYNVEEYIGRCIMQIQKNGYKNLEIICVDDGSKDNTLNVVKSAAEYDDRITVISKSNGGVASARNLGLDSAKGQYIAFVDPDDWIHPKYFETMVLIAQKEKVDLVQCGHVRVDGDLGKFDKIVKSYTKKYFHEGIKYACFRLYVWGKLYSSKSIGKLRFNESLYTGSDCFFVAELFSKNTHLEYVHMDAAMYYYYISRSEQLTKNGNVDNVCKSASIWYESASNCKDPLAKKHFLIECLKKCWSVRYWAMFRPDAKKYRKESEEIMESAFHDLLEHKVLSTKEKIMYGVFISFPIAYRVYRIKNDPGMRQWEKNEKNIKGIALVTRFSTECNERFHQLSDRQGNHPIVTTSGMKVRV